MWFRSGKLLNYRFRDIDFEHGCHNNSPHPDCQCGIKRSHGSSVIFNGIDFCLIQAYRCCKESSDCLWIFGKNIFQHLHTITAICGKCGGDFLQFFRRFIQQTDGLFKSFFHSGKICGCRSGDRTDLLYTVVYLP